MDAAGIDQTIDRQRIGFHEARGFVNGQHYARRHTEQAPLFLDQTLRLHKRSLGFNPYFGSASHRGWRIWIFLVMVDNFY